MTSKHASNEDVESIIDLAKKLIAIRSTEDSKTNLQEIISFTANQLTEFTIQQFLSNGKPSLLIHNTKPGTKHFKVIFNAHLDVVPGKKNQFKPYVRNGKLYGRGAYDMKAEAAVMILLFKDMAKKINYPFALQLVTDEEIGGHHGTKYQIEKGVAADFVIAGEFSGIEIKNKSKGALWLKLTTRGKNAHAAYLWNGENALWKMYEILEKIKNLYPTPKESSWVTTVNIAKIETQNNTFNKVPDESTAWLDIRSVIDNDLIVEKIKKIVPRETEIEVVMQEKPAYTDPDNSYILMLQKIVKQYFPKEGEITGVNGLSDVRFYNTIINVPGVEFGPKGSGAHSDEEWVSIDSLQDYYTILKRFLLST